MKCLAFNNHDQDKSNHMLSTTSISHAKLYCIVKILWFAETFSDTEISHVFFSMPNFHDIKGTWVGRAKIIISLVDYLRSTKVSTLHLFLISSYSTPSRKLGIRFFLTVWTEKFTSRDFLVFLISGDNHVFPCESKNIVNISSYLN